MLQLAHNPHSSSWCSSSTRQQHAAIRRLTMATTARQPVSCSAGTAAAAEGAWRKALLLLPSHTAHQQRSSVVLSARRGNDVPVNGSGMSAMVTRSITAAESLPELENVAAEWGGSFSIINTSAAFTKLAKLHDSRSPAAQPLLRWLCDKWTEQLPETDTRGMANVLWACGRLGQRAADRQLWDSTLAALVRAVAATDEADPPEGTAQQCGNTMWACAKLQRPPTAEQLDVLLQAFVQPAVLAAAEPQHTANTVWALSELRTSRGFKADVSPQLAQQLFGQEQVQAVALAGKPQEISNTLLALSRLASGRDRTPLLSLGFAQQAAQQLVDVAKQRRLGSWEAQHVANSLAACGELQLADAEFTQAAFTALDRCLPSCIAPNLAQAAFACEQLQHRDAGLLSRMLQRGQELVQQARPSEAGRTHNMVAKVAAAVAALDAQQLSGELVSLVAASGIKQQPDCHAANLQRLQKAHAWLQQLDGRGLADVLTEQQLVPGAGYGGGRDGRGGGGRGGGGGGRGGAGRGGRDARGRGGGRGAGRGADRPRPK